MRTAIFLFGLLLAACSAAQPRPAPAASDPTAREGGGASGMH